MRRFLSIAALVLVAAGIALYFMRARPVHGDGAPPPALSKLVLDTAPKTIPAAAFFDARGARLSLATFRGQPVLLNLWATWCAPCVSELPALARLQRALPGLKIVAVSEGREDASQARAFLKAHSAADLNVYVDSDHAFLAAMGVVGLPLSALIDRQGLERARASGPAEWDEPQSIAWLGAFVGRKE